MHSRWNYAHNDEEHFIYRFDSETWERKFFTEEPDMHFLLACAQVLADFGHIALECAGLVPVIGEVADGVNALWYFAEGDPVNGTLAGLSCIPFVGTATTIGKWTRNTIKWIKHADGDHWLSEAGLKYLKNDNGKDRLGHVMEHAENITHYPNGFPKDFMVFLMTPRISSVLLTRHGTLKSPII